VAITSDQLSPLLFWDVAPESFHWEQHRRWLLQRVLERGRWEDWLLVSSELTMDQIRDLEPSLKLAPRERRFLSIWLQRKNAR
jgi:hypothetical protein